MKVRWIAGFIVAIMLVAVAQARLVENFDYADNTSFNGTDQPGWRESGDTAQNWRVYGNVLICNGSTANSYLTYYGEEFDISSGYTVMAKVQFRNASADLSGWYSSSKSDGTTAPDTTDGNRFYYYNGARYYNDDSTIFGTNWGTKVFNNDTNYYIRQYAYYDSGDSQYHVKMWYSLGVIDADNPGTLFLDGAIGAPTGGFGNYVSLIHNSSGSAITYWDNLVFADGNYIPEPATMSIIGAGLLFSVFRKRNRK